MTIDGGTVVAEGDLDFRGTMGVKDEAGNNPPVGFKKIRLTTRLEVPKEDEGKVEKLLGLSERYCVVLQTLKAGVEVETKTGHVGAAVPDTRKDNEGDEQTNGGNGGEGTLNNQDVLRVN